MEGAQGWDGSGEASAVARRGCGWRAGAPRQQARRPRDRVTEGRENREHS